jgi:hypothetical protein
MPRTQKRSRTATQVPRNTITNTNTTSTKERNTMALTADQIAELLKDNRGRGDYGQWLTDFVASGSAGEQVDTESGLLAGKTADKVKTGLENAKKARDRDGNLKLPQAQNTLIVKKDDMVFVINRDAAAGAE